MIKIVHIIASLSYGGAEKLLYDLCRKIDKEKFSVSVVVFQDNNPLAKPFEESGISVKYFKKLGPLDFSIVRKVAKYLESINPDIVHTHLFGADYWGGQAAEMARVPYIVSTKHDVLNEGRLRNYLGSKKRRKFDRVIAISEAIREFLIKQEKIDHEKIAIIHNGVDVNRFLVDEPKLFPKENLRIGSVGRLSKEKGHKHLIRACRFLKNWEWHLSLVGDGPLRKELEQLALFLGIEEKVKFVGMVEDVREYLEKMDVFVLPSVSEGLSLAVLEAALAGKFIIATDVGGLPEIVTNKETGLLFKPKNIEQLVAHLNWVDEHREEARKMAARLQKEVMQKFDINKVIREYEKVYEDLVKSV
jgi:glycosyltransferase involved in cell wall biosynthesis